MERLDLSLLGLILAGGNSSRMGQDKALLTWNGTSLLHQMYQCAAAVCPSVYVITPRINHYQPLLPIACGFIPEQGQQQGPLRAFQEALDFLDPPQSTWILLLSCDLPNLQATVLVEWVQWIALSIFQQGEQSGESYSLPMAYLPRNPEGWWEPLCGFYSSQCRSSLARFLQQGGRSFQHWLNQERVGVLPLKDPELLLNLNTL